MKSDRLKNGMYKAATITFIGRSRDISGQVPKLAAVPELGSHRIPKLASLQLSGEVRGFIFPDESIGLEWTPNRTARRQGYERATAKSETLREAAARLFQERNNQLKQRIEAIEAAELFASLT